MHGEIPGSYGRYGCVISHIFAGSFLEAVEDIYEGTLIQNRKFHSEIKPVLCPIYWIGGILNTISSIFDLSYNLRVKSYDFLGHRPPHLEF